MPDEPERVFLGDIESMPLEQLQQELASTRIRNHKASRQAAKYRTRAVALALALEKLTDELEKNHEQ